MVTLTWSPSGSIDGDLADRDAEDADVVADEETGGVLEVGGDLHLAAGEPAATSTTRSASARPTSSARPSRRPNPTRRARGTSSTTVTVILPFVCALIGSHPSSGTRRRRPVGPGLGEQVDPRSVAGGIGDVAGRRGHHVEHVLQLVVLLVEERRSRR